MTTSENIEANADLIQWCVHVVGPDDLHAAPCHSAAVIQAREMNKAMHKKHIGGEPILCFAYAAPWPHSKGSHAEDLTNWLKAPTP